MSKYQKISLNGIEAFSRTPNKGQFAINGNWEEVFCFSPSSPPDLNNWVIPLNEGDNIAFEAFFGKYFIGIRNTGKVSNQEFIKNCIDAVLKSKSGQDFLEQLSLAFEVPALGQNFSFAELGAEEIWNTLGGIKLEVNQSKGLSNTFWDKILNSHVYNNTTHIKAVELAFDDVYHHWIAIPVSRFSFPFKVERKLVEAAIKLIELR